MSEKLNIDENFNFGSDDKSDLKAILTEWMSENLNKYKVVISTAGPGNEIPIKRIKIIRGNFTQKEIREKENMMAFKNGVEYMETIILPK